MENEIENVTKERDDYKEQSEANLLARDAATSLADSLKKQINSHEGEVKKIREAIQEKEQSFLITIKGLEATIIDLKKSVEHHKAETDKASKMYIDLVKESEEDRKKKR